MYEVCGVCGYKSLNTVTGECGWGDLCAAPLPGVLEHVSYDARYTAGEGDDTVYAVAYICPDPSLSGESVDEANLRVLSAYEDSWRVTYRHWTWARYVVILLPAHDAESVRASLNDYPVLDDMVWSEVECEWEESDDE